MRSRFDAQLELLHKGLTEMGAMCEGAIAAAVQALLAGDTEAARRLPPQDSEIDHKERQIETLCLRLLLQQQPVAQDLRKISAALKMITDLERIGDQAADIAEMVPLLQRPADFGQIQGMAREASWMVTRSIDAYVAQDVELAQRVIARDDVVDRLFDDMKTTLLSLLKQDTGQGEYALDLLLVAKYFERIGDHATNIAEWVMFSVTGQHKEMES